MPHDDLFPSPARVPEPGWSALRLTHDQREISKELHGIDPLLSGLFLSGLSVLGQSQSTLPARSALCAHAMRELMEKLPYKFFGIPITRQSQDLNKIAREIAASYRDHKTGRSASPKGCDGRTPLAPMGTCLLEQLEALSEFMKRPPTRTELFPRMVRELDKGDGENSGRRAERIHSDWTNLFYEFQGICHHNASAPIRAIDNLVDRLTDILRAIFVGNYLADADEIERIVKSGMEAPDEETLERLARLCERRDENRHRLFGTLDKPAWLDKLREAGIFRSPPAPVHDGAISTFAPWPEGQYLVRVADRVPHSVLKARFGLRETDHPTVHACYVRAALRMPVELAAGLAITEANWIRAQPMVPSGLADDCARLVVHLASLDRPDAAVALAKPLLELAQHDPLFGGQPCRLDLYDFLNAIEAVAMPLIKAARSDTLELLVKNLSRSFPDERRTGSDYSSLWRAAIEPHSRNENKAAPDAVAIMVDAIRDGAEFLVDDGEPIENVVRILTNGRTSIFARIALHILARHPDSEVARAQAAETSNFHDPELWHELCGLLNSTWPGLQPSERERILAIIEAGPPPSQLETKSSTAKTLKLHRKKWIGRRLRAIASHLPASSKQVLDRIEMEIGLIEHADFLDPPESSEGELYTPPSPKSLQDLQAMTGCEIAAYLKSNPTKAEGHMSDQEGLSYRLRDRVVASAETIVSDLQAFEGVRPIYASRVAEGLRAAMRSGPVGDPAKILAFANWIASPGAVPAVGESDEHYVSLTIIWSRLAALQLLDEAIDGNIFEKRHRAALWNVIANFLALLHAIPLEPPSVPSEGPLDRELNTVDGMTLRVALRYGRWVMAGAESAQAAASDAGIADELWNALDRALSGDLGPASREVLGRHFRQIFHVNRSWAEANAPRIFHRSRDRKLGLDSVAWLSHLRSSRSAEPCCEILMSEYRDAIQELRGKPSLADPPVQPGSSEIPYLQLADSSGAKGHALGFHLMQMMLSGRINWDGADGLLRDYAECASVPQLHAAVDWIGSCAPSNNPLTPEETTRLQAFWKDFSRWAASDASVGEVTGKLHCLKALGAWVEMSGLPRDWFCKHIMSVVERVGGIDDPGRVVRAMAEWGDKDLRSATRCVERLVGQKSPEFQAIRCRDALRSILGRALQNVKARKYAEATIGRLCEQGNMSFRDLLPPHHCD